MVPQDAVNAGGDTAGRSLDRRILALALPTFATLVSEPLLLLTDSAIVGHLGTNQLAALGLSANVLGIVVGLSIFLAYGTTGTVARRLGAGDRQGALAGGLDGLVLAAILGGLLTLGLQLTLPKIVLLYGTSPEVAALALTYLRIATVGLPFILLLLAGTGVLRGLQDTRTPLYVAIATNVGNVILNVSLVYGAGLGIAGSALGTLIAQTLSGLYVAAVVIMKARRAGAQLRFRPGGVLQAARSGVWLIIRTASLQAAITLTTVTAASFGAIALAAHQVVTSLWSLLAFGLDAIAIAGQSIIGHALGAGKVDLGRAMTRRMIGWGFLAGLAFGLLILVTRPLYVGLFTPDPLVQSLIGHVLLVVAVITPISGIVYVLDGVLIGAGDGRYLALAGLVALAAYVPLALASGHLTNHLAWLWVAYCGFMIARMITLTLRARGDRWIRLGLAP